MAVTPPSNPYPLTRVIWVDVECIPSWVGETGVDEQLAGIKACTVTSAGYLIRNTKEFVVLAQSVVWQRDGKEWHFSGLDCIPRGMVRKVERL